MMLRHLALSFAVLVMAPGAWAQPAATPPATMPTPLAVTTAPVEDPNARKIGSLSEIFTLSVTHGFLSVTTPLKPAETPLRVSHPDLPGGGEVRPMLMTGADDGVLRQFAFTTPPDGVPDVRVKTALSAIANQVQLTQDAETENSLYSVQFIQQLPFDPDGSEEPAVKLYVKLYDSTTGNATIDLRLAAGNFEDLRRSHPIEFSRHLVPLLALLQHDKALLGVPLETARQVLSEGAIADDKSTARVNELVSQLASPEPQTRDTAMAALQGSGDVGMEALAKVDRSKLSAEQNSQIDLVLASKGSAAPAELRQLSNDPLFLVDCLYVDDADLRTRAVKQLQEVTKLAVTFDNEATENARRKQIGKVREQVVGWATTRPATP